MSSEYYFPDWWREEWLTIIPVFVIDYVLISAIYGLVRLLVKGDDWLKFQNSFDFFELMDYITLGPFFAVYYSVYILAFGLYYFWYVEIPFIAIALVALFAYHVYVYIYVPSLFINYLSIYLPVSERFD